MSVRKMNGAVRLVVAITLASILGLAPAAAFAAELGSGAGGSQAGQAGSKQALLGASSASVALSTHEVELAQGQTDFSIGITVRNDAAYAGGELALQLADGVALASVAYSAEASKAGPVAADGLVWASYFSGTNSFNGSLTATANLRYSGEENTMLVLDRVSIYTINGNSVQRETLPLRESVVVKRAGANNSVPDLEQPAVPDYGSGTSGTGTGTTGSGSGTGSAGTSLVSLPLDTQSSAASSSSVSRLADSGGLSSLAENQTPLASSGEIPTQDGSSGIMSQILGSPVLWALVGFCAAMLVLLGYVLIKRRRQEDKNAD